MLIAILTSDHKQAKILPETGIKREESRDEDRPSAMTLSTWTQLHAKKIPLRLFIVWATQFYSVATEVLFSFPLKFEKLPRSSPHGWHIFVIHLKTRPVWRSSTFRPLLVSLCCLTLESKSPSACYSFGEEWGPVLSLLIGELACPRRAGVLHLGHTVRRTWDEAAAFSSSLWLEDCIGLFESLGRTTCLTE